MAGLPENGSVGVRRRDEAEACRCGFDQWIRTNQPLCPELPLQTYRLIFKKLLPMKKLIKMLSLLSISVVGAWAQVMVNVDANQVAIQGYDPVAFFTDAKPLPGRMEITSTHEGAIYRFTSAEHRDLFNKNPDAYVPACGGFCAFGVANGHTAPVKIETWQIAGGHLIFNYNTEVKAEFDKQRSTLLQQADANWQDRAKVK
jgi:YHS domain-containing protein